MSNESYQDDKDQEEDLQQSLRYPQGKSNEPEVQSDLEDGGRAPHRTKEFYLQPTKDFPPFERCQTSRIQLEATKTTKTKVARGAYRQATPIDTGLERLLHYHLYYGAHHLPKEEIISTNTVDLIVRRLGRISCTTVYITARITYQVRRRRCWIASGIDG